MATTKVLSTLAMSGLGVAAALGVANNAEALPHMLYSSTDFMSSMAQKSTSSSTAFNVIGSNSVGVTTSRAYRSGSTISANVTTQGGSMYARAYARCYTTLSGNLYSAVYSDWTTNSTSKTANCDSLIDLNGATAGNGWVMTNWGAIVLSWADSNISKVTRTVCNGQGCGPGDSIPVSLRWQQCAGFPSDRTLVGGFASGGMSTFAGSNPSVCDVPTCW